jgi:diadenosine tetraphosphate (Ap4A) HIT family hydrolase
LFSTAKKVAAEIGVIEGYKLYFNVWPQAQDIMHVHLHLISDI